MTEHPAAPRTEAARDLMTNLSKVADSDSWAWWAMQGILAIESEARAAARKEVLLSEDELIDIIEQAIFETGTGLEAAVLAAERILDSLSTDTREEPTDE